MWGKFAKAMLAGKTDVAKKIFTAMVGEERIAARRWLFGPTAAERKESSARQAAISRVTRREIIENCQIYALAK